MPGPPTISSKEKSHDEQLEQSLQSLKDQRRVTKKRSGPSRMVSRPARIAQPEKEEPEVIVEEVEVSSGGGGSQYITPNYELHVFMALSLAFIFTLLSAYARGKNVSNKTPNQYLDPKADPIKFATAWIVLAFVLLASARFRGTDKLAAAFAWLIFVAVLLVNGEDVFTLFATPPTHSGGGGGKKR